MRTRTHTHHHTPRTPPLTPSHPHTFAHLSHPLHRSSHSHTLTLSHPHTLTPCTLTPSPSHPHPELYSLPKPFAPLHRSSHPHTFTPSHPRTFASSHPHTLTLSHPHTLTPTLPLPQSAIDNVSLLRDYRNIRSTASPKSSPRSSRAEQTTSIETAQVGVLLYACNTNHLASTYVHVHMYMYKGS